MPDKSLDINVKATDGASSTFASIGKKYEDMLHQLRQQGGRRSALGETAELFEGKGALVGVSMIGNQVKEATEKWQELQKELTEGKKSTGEIVEKFSEGLPVIGSWVEAGRSIRSMLDGSAAAAEELNAENNLTTSILDLQLSRIKAAHAEHEKILETIKQIQNATALLNMPGPSRGEETIRQQRVSQEEETEKAIAAKKLEIETAYETRLAEARKAASAAAMKVGDAYQKEARENEDTGAYGRTDDAKKATMDRKDAESAAAAAGGRAKNLAAARDAEQAEATKDLQAKLKAEQEKDAAELRELKKKQDEQMTAEHQAAANKTAAVDSETRAARLERDKDFYGAELERAKQHHAEMLAEIAKQATEQAKKSPGNFGSNLPAIAADQAKAIMAEQARFDEQLEEAKKTAAEKNRAIADQQADAEARVRQEALKSLEAQVQAGDKGKSLELEQLKITDEYAQRQKELVALAIQEKDHAQILLAIKQQLAGLAGQEQQAHAQTTKDHAKSIQETIDSAHETSLRQQQEAGNAAAGVELKRLEIIKQFREEAEKLNAVMKDPHATDPQKAAAAAELAQAKAAADKALAQAGQSQAGPLQLANAGGVGMDIAAMFKEESAAAYASGRSFYLTGPHGDQAGFAPGAGAGSGRNDPMVDVAKNTGAQMKTLADCLKQLETIADALANPKPDAPFLQGAS